MLSRQFRLRHRSDFTKLRQSGKKVVGPFAVLIYVQSSQTEEGPRIGFSAGKRIGNAVTRNRAKRLVREAVKSSISHIKPGSLCLFVARRRINDATLEEVTRSVEKLLTKARLLERDVSQI